MDYVYIRAYSKLKGEFPYYTVSVVEQARAQKAPATATHKLGGKWFTLNDIKSPLVKDAVERLAQMWI